VAAVLLLFALLDLLPAFSQKEKKKVLLYSLLPLQLPFEVRQCEVQATGAVAVEVVAGKVAFHTAVAADQEHWGCPIAAVVESESGEAD